MRMGQPDRAEVYLRRALQLSRRHHSGSLVHATRGDGRSSFGGTPRDGLEATAAMQSIALLRVQQERHPEVRAIHGTVALNSNAQSLAVRSAPLGVRRRPWPFD
jgi:hypothetical protein